MKFTQWYGLLILITMNFTCNHDRGYVKIYVLFWDMFYSWLLFLYCLFRTNNKMSKKGIFVKMKISMYFDWHFHLNKDVFQINLCYDVIISWYFLVRNAGNCPSLFFKIMKIEILLFLPKTVYMSFLVPSAKDNPCSEIGKCFFVNFVFFDVFDKLWCFCSV